nr:hypothetical protein [Actinopolymorpha pittospori]
MSSFVWIGSGPTSEGYGGIGWLLDRHLGTSFLLPVGILVGLTLALYLVFKRYGYREPHEGS